MKYDAPGLICSAADAIRRKDPGSAYALYELASNLQKLMRGKASLEEWKRCYADLGPDVDADERMPG
ncbi:MAG TPA: hypothetical protein VGV39_15285 [Mesorhizobium sp.]|jgi:hypothetical protein|uniref:hypothetical protein n=1 Tax=Mesorhizobium sp. TaxID=1871066 RepID=UPI002DDD5CE8|nr:hypothetical protein [Mesorhizobium sp.]HEV2504441.1 hypothetical protein [Mesorhizobium sp.]